MIQSARPSNRSVKVHQEFALDRELRIEMELVTCRGNERLPSPLISHDSSPLLSPRGGSPQENFRETGRGGSGNLL